MVRTLAITHLLGTAPEMLAPEIPPMPRKWIPTLSQTNLLVGNLEIVVLLNAYHYRAVGFPSGGKRRLLVTIRNFHRWKSELTFRKMVFLNHS